MEFQGKQTAEEYLKANKVEELLEEIVVSLLKERPMNVKKHISQMMAEVVPFPGKSTAREVTSKQARYNQAETLIGARRFSAVSPEALLKSRDTRRKGFSSKSISNTTMEIPSHPKSEAVTKNIEEILKKVSFLSFLKQEQISALINAMFEAQFEEGKVIIQQGDRADNFYIVQNGSVDIFKKAQAKAGEVELKPDENGKIDYGPFIVTLGQGAYFGELALMSGGRRAATVIAKTKVSCWAIDQTTYLYLLKDLHYQRRQQCREIIAKVPLLADLPDYEALLIAESLIVEEFPENTTIIKQGEKGDKFFMIISGDAEVFVGGNCVNTIHSKGYFGELALIYDVPRAASVISKTPLKTASIAREMFRKVLDKCASKFKANEKSYGLQKN